jgi:hypothetical protein
MTRTRISPAPGETAPVRSPDGLAHLFPMDRDSLLANGLIDVRDWLERDEPSLRFRAAVTVGLAIVSWGTIAVCYWLIVSGAL